MKHEKLIFMLKQKKKSLGKKFFSGCIKIYSLFHVVYFSSFFKIHDDEKCIQIEALGEMSFSVM